jgi:hypothetical protein
MTLSGHGAMSAQMPHCTWQPPWGTTAQLWLNLQASYDLPKAQIENGEELFRDVHLLDCCAFG